MYPTLGHIGPITLRTYTVLLDLALLAGLGALAWRGWRVEKAPARWLDAGLGALVLGLVAGRAGHVAVHWNYFTEHRNQMAQFWSGGLDWHAAVAGGLLGLGLYSFVTGLPFRRVSDTLALPLAFGSALVWTGCLMASCAYGAEVRSLADYPSPIVAELPDLYGLIAPRFTSQLYGAALGVILMLPAWLLRLVTWQQEGVRLWVVLALLGAGAFAVGYTRGDVVSAAFGLRLDQVLDLAMVALSLIGLAVTLVIASLPDDAERAVEHLLADEGATDAA